MKLPQSAPSTFDRVATREELFQVLEVLGGFEEPQATTELAQTRDLLACLETDSLITPSEILDELTSSEERLLRELDPFNSLLQEKAERVN